MEDWLGVTKIATDPLGRAQNVQYSDGKTIYYGFDEQIRLSELRDVDLEHFLHLHFGLTNKARKIHRTGIIEAIIGIVTGTDNIKDIEEICDQ